MNSRSERLENIKAAHRSIDLNEETNLICQQSYRPGKQRREVLCETIDKDQEAVVIKSAQSEWVSPFILVPNNE